MFPRLGVLVVCIFYKVTEKQEKLCSICDYSAGLSQRTALYKRNDEIREYRISRVNKTNKT